MLSRRRRNWKKPLLPLRKRDHKKEEKEKGKSCGHCRKTGAHPPSRNCSAYGQHCLKFGRYNHSGSFWAKILPKPKRDITRPREGKPDGGASANVMDEYQFKALKRRSPEVKELGPSSDTLKTLKSDLRGKGEFTATLRNKLD